MSTSVTELSTPTTLQRLEAMPVGGVISLVVVALVVVGLIVIIVYYFLSDHGQEKAIVALDHCEVNSGDIEVLREGPFDRPDLELSIIVCSKGVTSTTTNESDTRKLEVECLFQQENVEASRTVSSEIGQSRSLVVHHDNRNANTIPDVKIDQIDTNIITVVKIDEINTNTIPVVKIDEILEEFASRCNIQEEVENQDFTHDIHNIFTTSPLMQLNEHACLRYKFRDNELNTTSHTPIPMDLTDLAGKTEIEHYLPEIDVNYIFLPPDVNIEHNVTEPEEGSVYWDAKTSFPSLHTANQRSPSQLISAESLKPYIYHHTDQPKLESSYGIDNSMEVVIMHANYIVGNKVLIKRSYGAKDPADLVTLHLVSTIVPDHNSKDVIDTIISDEESQKNADEGVDYGDTSEGDEIKASTKSVSQFSSEEEISPPINVNTREQTIIKSTELVNIFKTIETSSSSSESKLEGDGELSCGLGETNMTDIKNFTNDSSEYNELICNFDTQDQSSTSRICLDQDIGVSLVEEEGPHENMLKHKGGNPKCMHDEVSSLLSTTKVLNFPLQELPNLTSSLLSTSYTTAMSSPISLPSPPCSLRQIKPNYSPKLKQPLFNSSPNDYSPVHRLRFSHLK